MTQPLTPEQLEQAKAQLGGMFQAQAQPAYPQAFPQAPVAPYPTAPQAPAPSAYGAPGAGLAGLLIPVTLQDGRGDDVPAHLLLGPAAAQDPRGAIEQLQRAGWHVKSFQPRRNDDYRGGRGGWRGGR